MPFRRGRGFEFEVYVTFPWSMPAVGAHVWVGPAEREEGFPGVSGSVDEVGIAKLWWPRDTSPKKGVVINVSLEDHCEVNWEVWETQELAMPKWYGTGGHRESVPGRMFVTLLRGDQRRVPLLFVRPDVRWRLMHHRKGRYVLHDFDEYCEALRKGLPASAMVMGGKAIEGIIKLVAQHENWWNPGWDRRTLGELLNETVVKEKLVQWLGSGFVTKLGGTSPFRNPAAHQNWVWTTLSEAQGISSMVVDVLNALATLLPLPV